MRTVRAIPSGSMLYLSMASIVLVEPSEPRAIDGSKAEAA
jgi:hypothetical protein